MPSNTLDPEPEFTVGAIPTASDGAEPPLPISERAGRPKVVRIVVLALVASAAAGYFLWLRYAAPPEQPAPPLATSNVVPQTQPEPAIRHPVERIPGSAESDSGGAQFPLPKLDDSDVVAKDAIATILNGDTFVRLLVSDAVVRHIVATVDNLPRKAIAVRILPIKPVPGPFATASGPRGMAIAGANGSRYTTYVQAAEAIDTKRLAEFYVRLYPLFQQAYVELGYPDGYFNDRLIGVIDHLLAAPEPAPPVYLSQPKIRFEFADPALEDLSAGQKILVTVGVDNEMRLKAKLREIRKALTSEAAHP